MTNNLFQWRNDQPLNAATFVKPRPLKHDQWPPDYRGVYAWRMRQLDRLRNDERLLAHARAYYSQNPAEFIMHWMDTYNPRKTDNKWIPFVFFERQQEFIMFLHECRTTGENGLVEKCRDAGVTWLACAYSVWSWLFVKNDAIGWGSRKQDLVDKIGNPDSIFQKMRLILSRLPNVWLPSGFNAEKHATYMRLINPQNGSVIMGEAGDNIGRGGRTSLYLKDESAHYERPEKIEAALGDNTNVQIDISSVNGLGNVFHRRREAGIDWRPGAQIDTGFTRVFVFDWRNHPEKTQEWYDRRKAKYEREGMAHLFAQEVERNYSAAVQNTLIPYEWIEAAVDAHKKMNVPISDVWTAGLDVADGGIDRNALVKRQWIIWRTVEEWGERDTGVTTRRAIAVCRQHKGIKIQYDSIGMGSSVKAEYNRLIDDKVIDAATIKLVAWNAGASVVKPFERVIPDDEESLLNKDMFGNMKAQAWWSIRARFYRTFKFIKHGEIYPFDEMISLDSSMLLLPQVMKELAQPTKGENSGLKTIVNKKPDGTKSPNLADAGVMAFFPVDDSQGYAIVGNYG